MVLGRFGYPRFRTFCPGNGSLTAVQEMTRVKLGAIYLVRTLPPHLYGTPLYPLVRNSASNQMNALVRLKRYIGHGKRFVFVNSLSYSNFNYCLLEWMFSSKRSKLKICKKELFALF